jgi:PAS domain S-box-containing protein
LRKMKLSVKYANMVFWEYDREKHLCLFYSSTISSYHDVTKATEEQIISNVHPDDKHKMKDLIDRMHEGDEEIISTDVRLLSATDKKWHFCNPIATAFKRDSETGKVSMYVGFTCDYSEVYKLNKEVADYARKLNYLIESSKVKLWSYDLSTKIVSFRDGDKVRTMLPEDVVAKDDDKVRSRSIFDQMDKGEIGEFSIQVKYTLNGRTYHTINNGIPVKDDKGNLTGYFGSLRDITDLIEIQNRLEQEKEKAQQADKLKSTFLANMSHEIRTPLNAIIGFADILVDVDSRDEKQEFVNIIRLNSDTLLRIISDILDLSKIEAGTIDLKNEEFDLSLMFNDFATGISPMVTEGIEYIIDNPYPKCFVKGDKERIVQVLTNFVTNAIKYTSQGHIKVGYKYDNDGMLFYCEDTGVGIEEAKQKLVFERFEKLGSMVQGTGLGLAICKAIADCLKGYIWVESKYGEGSTFYIWLPLQPRYE